MVCVDLCKTMCADVNEDHLRKYVRSRLKELRSRGVVEFIDIGKKHYNIAVRTALRQSFEPIKFRKSDKKGFPKALHPLKKYLLSDDPQQVRTVLTLLRAVYHFESQAKPQVTSIVTPSNVTVEELPWFDDFVDYAHYWAKPFKVSQSSWKPSDLHVTTKAGPSGLALISCVNDLFALVKDKRLFNTIQHYLMVSNQKELLNYMKYIYGSFQKDPIVPSKTLSRLAFLPEGGNKTRTVAIGDYWSQCALKGLHKGLMMSLKKMTTDGTYNQGNLASVMLTKTKEGKPIYCFDLTTATDRFPVVLQQVVLGSMTSDEQAYYWRMLLCGRDFTTIDGSVRYSVGQPMGLLSSWAAFAVTHHVIIEFAAASVGLKSFRDYIVLGDDVAIFNSKVAKRYRNILMELEVPISKDKSIISAEGSVPCGEIAKRIFKAGHEISPIPPDLIRSAKKNKLLFANLVREYMIRSGDCRLQPWAQLAQRWFLKDHAEVIITLSIPPGYPGSLFKDMESWRAASASLEGGWYAHLTQHGPEKVTEAYRSERITSLESKINRTMRKVFKYLGKETEIEGEAHYEVAFSDIFRNRIGQLGVGIPDSLESEVKTPLLLITAKYIQDLFDLRDRVYDGEVVGDLDEREYLPDVFAVKYFRTKQEYKRLTLSSTTLRVFKSLSNDQ